MDFLRDQGDGVGCFANRYLTLLDEAGRPTEKTYGLGWWRTLADLERWSESHPTHLAIFGAFMKMATPAPRPSCACTTRSPSPSPPSSGSSTPGAESGRVF
jgi:hypothetical protein